MPEPVLFKGENFPVARAVIASSCVPFAFTPIDIDQEFYKNSDQFGTVRPKLVDGGVYDNQGAHKLTQGNSSYKCDIVIVSDAGDKLPFEQLYNNTFTLLLRTVDTFMSRIKHFQMVQNLYSKSKVSMSFQSIGWDLENCISGFYGNLIQGNIKPELSAYHQLEEHWLKEPQLFKKEIMTHLEKRCKQERISNNSLSAEQLAEIRKVGTNLTPIKADVARNLMVHAQNITELQIRLYCPEIL